ncbi:invasion associated locus B family protein [Hyphomicrobium sp. MC8b]|uniref:invasion associated locus B family protein n=1 Tax=Hyphomicrobium sp. MC8b TaxID=300273 RepID=UPI00391B1C9D
MTRFLVLTVLIALSILGSKHVHAEASRQVIGDWVVTCTPPISGHKSCMMTQALASGKLGQTVSVFTIGRDRAGTLKASIRVPVGVSLPDGVIVGIENGDRFKVPYSACHRIGCFAPFDLTEPLLGKMRKATKISAVAQSVSQRPLALNFSVRGFPAAYERYVNESR